MRASFQDYKIVDSFNSEYWSGNDMNVYIGDVFIDEATQLNFTVSEQTRPYYSYDSYVPSRIYHGSRIVAGELTLNFKRDATIYSFLNLLRQKQNRYQTSTNSSLSNTQSSSVPAYTTVQPVTISQITTNPDAARNYMKAKKAQVNTSGYQPPTSTISDTSGIFEISKTGMEMHIVLGGHLNSAQTLKMITDSDNYWVDGAVVPAPGISATTGLKLIGVEFAALARPMGDDGRGFMETYSFTARNIQVMSQAEISGPNSQQAVQQVHQALATNVGSQPGVASATVYNA